jgi:UDP-glucose 4-epimerase
MGAVYAITGSSGYIGTRMTRLLLERDPECTIIGMDVRPPRGELRTHPRLEHHTVDVRDARLRMIVNGRGVEALLHFAFVLDPFYDEKEMTEIDLGGTRNVMQAALEAKIPWLLATSSTTAYGALVDNPPRLDEDMPTRARPDFNYAHDKRLMDELLRDFAARHPEVGVCIVRPCIVLGPNVSNYIAATLVSLPVGSLLDGANPETQFVHEDDVVNLIWRCLDRRATGVFNAVGRGTLRSTDLAALQGKRTVKVPYRVARALTWAVWRARLLGWSMPPGVVDYFRYPWVASGDKARRELDFEARYTSEECFRIILQRKDAIVDDFKQRMAARGKR